MQRILIDDDDKAYKAAVDRDEEAVDHDAKAVKALKDAFDVYQKHLNKDYSEGNVQGIIGSQQSDCGVK